MSMWIVQATETGTNSFLAPSKTYGPFDSKDEAGDYSFVLHKKSTKEVIYSVHEVLQPE